MTRLPSSLLANADASFNQACGDLSILMYEYTGHGPRRYWAGSMPIGID
jgi:hypothetical protein